MQQLETTKIARSSGEKDIFLFRLTNSEGNFVELTNVGASILKICIKDRDSKLRDLVLAYASPLDYFKNPAYMGCVLGRTAGRIEGGMFELNKEKIILDRNNDNNCLHGGNDSLSDKVFEVKLSKEDHSVSLSYLSKDMESGFPGNLFVEITYSFTDTNKLIITYLASCDKPGPVNLSNHSYFNLNGHNEENIENHFFKFNADSYSLLNDELIPTRDESVDLSVFDFRNSKNLKDCLNDKHEQLLKAGGFDHNFIISRDSHIKSIEEAAEAYSPKTGIRLKMHTTEKCFQFYTGNFLGSEITGKDNSKYLKRQGFCLEAQSWPNGVNNKNYDSSILKKEDSYQQSTVYEFIVDN